MTPTFSAPFLPKPDNSVCLVPRKNKRDVPIIATATIAAKVRMVKRYGCLRENIKNMEITTRLCKNDLREASGQDNPEH